MNTTTISETLTYFQWTRGENLGDIEEWNGEQDTISGETFYIFKSGKMANTNLENEFFSKISSPNEPLIDSDYMNIPAAKPLATKDTIINKRPLPTPVLQATQNPVASLLNKSIKTDTIQNVRLSISLPPKDLIKVVANSFEDGEETVLSYLVEQISIDDIKQQIKNQLQITLFTKKIK